MSILVYRESISIENKNACGNRCVIEFLDEVMGIFDVAGVFPGDGVEVVFNKLSCCRGLATTIGNDGPSRRH